MIVPLSISTKNRKVAVLTPHETDLLLDTMTIENKIRANYLLETAMRISEAKYVQQHPECFRKENTTIFLPMVEGMGKVKCTIKNRPIQLSTRGIDAVEKFFAFKATLPSYQAMEQSIKISGKNAGFDASVLTPKMWRKTMVSWLMAVFPERQMQISFSCGHDYNTMRNHYLVYGWRKEDKNDMKERLDGW